MEYFGIDEDPAKPGTNSFCENDKISAILTLQRQRIMGLHGDLSCKLEPSSSRMMQRPIETSSTGTSTVVGHGLNREGPYLEWHAWNKSRKLSIPSTPLGAKCKKSDCSC